MPSSQNVPQNAEEASLIAFALIDALIERLVAIRKIDKRIAREIFETAALVLEKSSQLGSSRAAEFLRRTRLSGPGEK